MRSYYRFALPILMFASPCLGEETPGAPAKDTGIITKEGQTAPSQPPPASPPAATAPTAPQSGTVPELPPVKVIVTPERTKPSQRRPRSTAGKPEIGKTHLPTKAITPPATKAKTPPATAASRAGAPARQASPAANAWQAAEAANAAVVQSADTLNAARENILPKIGVNTYEVNRETIEALPQGDNAPLDKVLLQTPGVYQDSAASR